MTATIIQSDVTNFAPELSSVSAAAWADILAYVNEFDLTQTPNLGFYLASNTGASDQTDRMAKIFLAAHIGKMDLLARSNAAGPVTGESVGGIRRSYGMYPILTSAGSLGLTIYGRMYLDIINAECGGPMLV